jgi:hypothetical protein
MPAKSSVCQAIYWIVNGGAGVIDSQSVKTTDGGCVRRYDVGKRVKGQKRHIITDTNGFFGSCNYP